MTKRAVRLGGILVSLYLSQALLTGCSGQGPRPANNRTESERRNAGNAAAFVKPGADNSVPTFGSEASAAERAGAEAGLRAYLGARAAREWRKACSLLAAPVRRSVEALAASTGGSAASSSCDKALPALAPLKPGVPANPLRGALLAFRVRGANAFALFYGPPGRQKYVVPMNREGGAWRPTQTAPIAYPPGSAAGAYP